jgi:hypothetical protein
MSKEIKPTNVRDIEYEGEVKRTDTNEDVTEINDRAFEHLGKYAPGKYEEQQPKDGS